MKPVYAILPLFLLLAISSTAQVTMKVLNLSDSTAIVDVVCSNTQTNVIAFTNEKGLLELKRNNNYVLVHPSFYSLKIDNLQRDTTVYLKPLIREIEEVVIISMSNENLFKSFIQKYRSDLANSTRKGILYYKNTNWFTYQYKNDQTTDSAFCSIENILNFEYTEAKKKSEILFSPLSLNRSCSSFSLPKNSDIETAQIPGFSRLDFSHFLNALFTQGSYFDKIGFDHTQTTKREDTLNKTIELKFVSDECEKVVVISSIDSTLISYQFRFISKMGSYHVYYATFSNQQVQTLYEEKGYLFNYEKQNHLFNSVHYGNFETMNEIQVMDSKPFAEIIKDQSTENSENETEVLYPLYKKHLIPMK
ncbi:MAG: hypothetical protein A3D31_17565 [Candidatus Fluviicola riflensis]|nr:MAG: hypothetical protein CHH17_02505 [Candidatus Fluviicola riflensis]OGS76793.1 MAG: hypothetical protein A3D31_17565 [Candidatus Fluviicola riflensis]OGS82852.1 MAG: hypothetical protein A2724_13795 [Fluviicola sp. RIFCSPHIGHO2_01_FULL_43_53]OGS88523.1 MAG: hypothetical protein A3E30_07070 [Fluviicola sp. RIFCSPHIGHO2_12_FULL_43_24]